MQDQHFLNGWNRDAGDFAADLHRTFNQLRQSRQNRDQGAQIIGSPYDRLLERRRVEPAHRELSPAAKASLRGLAASVITFALWTATMLIMTPTPGLAAALDPSAATVAECTVPVAVA